MPSHGDGAGRPRPRSFRTILADAAAIGATVSGLALLGLAWSFPTRRDVSRVEAGVDGFVAVTVDQRAIPAAKAAAASIDEASARAEAQAKVFAEMLRSADLNGDIVFEVSDAIREFGESVADVEQFLRTVDGTLPAITKALTGTAAELRGWQKSRLPIGGLVDREGLAEKADGLDQAAQALENLSDQFLPAVLIECSG